MRLVRAAWAIVLVLTIPAVAWADPHVEKPGNSVSTAPITGGERPEATVGVRFGDHTGYGRIVFDMPKGATVQTVTEGSRMLLVFTGAAGLAQTGALPRNLSGMDIDGPTATLTLSPGSRARQQRLGDRLVVDLFDPEVKADEASKKQAATPPSTQRPQPVTGRLGAPKSLAPPADVHAQAVTPAAAVADPAPVAPVQSDTLSPPGQAPVTEPAPKPAPLPPHPAVLLQADTTVGAAAFRRGHWGMVVLDRRMKLPSPTDLPGALITEGPVSTVLQIPIDADQALSLERTSAGWTVSIGDALSPGALIPQPVPDGVAFPMQRSGRSVSILDPLTGGTLLVGTSLGAGNEAAVGVERRTPAFSILPTWLGVAIEPISDQVDLHAGAVGFMLHGGGAPALEAGPTGKRHFDLPDEPVPALLNRLRAQLASAAAAAPRARTQPRIAAIQAMLALGLGVEAQALAQTTAADDPEAASDTTLATAGAVAAVLAGRLDETSALDNTEQATEPELDLWQGLRDRQLGRETEAARRLASHLTLAHSYPDPLRRLVWPDVAEAAAETGVPVPADQITPFAAALALEHAGKLDEAIAAWQALASGSDRRDQVRATMRAAELQLAAGRIGPAEAADIMERQSFAWRGDGMELSLRLRAAELRGAAGGWRAALDFLRATDALFPDQREPIRREKTAIFEAMMAADGARLTPLDVVMLASDYADCVPDGGKDLRLARLLAEKLMALDLPARAIPVLQGLVKGTEAGPARAEFGLRLGQLLLDGGDAAGALTALQASEFAELPPELAENRGILTAKSQAALGQPMEAAASLAALHSPTADDLRASLLGQVGDWQGSLAALTALADKTLPAEGPLPAAAQSLVVREATAAVQSRDTEQLRRIGSYLPRMSGASADMLRVLTETAITSTSELPRAASELTLARGVPKQIQAVARR